MTILDALKKMHRYNYMHLPVQNGNSIIGLVNVQQLTMAMLHYLYKKSVSQAKGKEPVWSAFWDSAFAPTSNDESESPLRFEDSSLVDQFTHHSILPSNSVSEINAQPIETTLAFKIKDVVRGATYKLSFGTDSMAELLVAIRQKLLIEEFQHPLYYIDEEQDSILIGSEQDLQDAITAMQKLNIRKLMLVYGNIEPRSDLEKTETTIPLPLLNTNSGKFNVSSLMTQIALTSGIVVISAFLIKKLWT